MQYQYIVKCITIGNSGVGKTSIISRYSKGVFHESMVSTIGVDLSLNKINIGKHEVILNLWDTGGQERFRAISKSYVANSNVIIIVFDLSEDFKDDDFNYWYNFVVNNNKDPIICVVGTKIDLVKNLDFKKKVLKNENKYRKKCEEKNLDYISVSSKTGKNIFNLFELIINRIARYIFANKIQKKQIPQKNQTNDNLVVEHTLKLVDDKGIINHKKINKSKKNRNGCCY